MKESDMTIGNTLKDRRINLNIKQEDVAEQMGVTVQTVSKWERDLTEPKASQVHQLGKVLQLSEKEICQGKALENKGNPFDFVRKVSILMSEVPQTELLVGMQEFIDDENGFLEMLAGISNYPFELLDREKKGLSEYQQKNELLFELYEQGGISFKKKEEEERFLKEMEDWKNK